MRVIEYRLEGVEETEPLYRLITTLLDAENYPAQELSALYSERWEIEITLDEFKTHMRGGRVVLRSKTPELVEQEFYGMMLAHRAVRTLMNEAALRENLDPDRLSFTHAISRDPSQAGCHASPFPLRPSHLGWKVSSQNSFKSGSRLERNITSHTG